MANPKLMTPQNLVFYPLVVLRSPCLPFTTPVSGQQVIRLLADPFFQEALFLASPDLYARAMEPGAGPAAPPPPAVLAALVNYLNRMRSRSTPFGLFASCSLVPWAGTQPITLASTSRRHTRLDMQYVCSLAQALSRHKPLQQHLLYFPNSSWYQVGDQIRYIEYHYENGQRTHQHTAVHASGPLLTLLSQARTGLTPAGLYAGIKTPDHHPEEISQFIEELIDAQVLVSELEPVLTGEEFSTRLLQVLSRLQASHPDRQLAAVLRALKQVDRQLQQFDARAGARPADYEQISRLLPPLTTDKSKLFQVDLIRPAQAGGLPAGLQQQLLDFVPLFLKLAGVEESARLADFRQKFRARYEGQAKPLLEVLDPDTGIGYGAAAAPGCQPLVADLELPAAAPGPPQPIRRHAARQLLSRQVRAAERKGQKVIQLGQADLAALPDNPAPLPPSLAVIFRVPRPHQVQLEALSGPSALNLISRFAHADAGFRQLAQSIAAREEALNPGVLFAQVLHLPEERTGNILLRPHLRPYEIPYLAASGLPPSQQIPLQDLYLQVTDDKILLFSRALNQQIIPRLDTAHHYSAASLPVYLLLSDLQGQGLQAEAALNWLPEEYDTHYLPRLTYGDFILGLATWQLDREALTSLLQAQPAELMREFRHFQQAWGLPDRFTFSEGDRDLLIDTHNPDTIGAWLHTVRQRPSITLREYLYDPHESLVRDAGGNPYGAQFIAPLINQSPVYRPLAAPPPCGEEAQAFPPGSEWLYYKLYGGSQATETVLTEVLAPLTRHLQQAKLIDQWFFLRYQDPEAHLRLRLHLPAPEKVGEVISQVYQQLRPYQQAGLIWKTQTCTYQRETGRYGAGAMLLAEQLFFADSLAVAGYLTQRPQQETQEDQRWIWGLTAIDQLLSCFDYGLAEKLRLICGLRDMFAREFKLDKRLKMALDKKYRHYRPDIALAFAGLRGGTRPLALPYQSESLALVQAVADQLRERGRRQQLEVPLEELLASFIHLHVNRLMPAQPRLHELLLYDFLCRYYKSELALQQKDPLISSLR